MYALDLTEMEYSMLRTIIDNWAYDRQVMLGNLHQFRDFELSLFKKLGIRIGSNLTGQDL